MLTTVLTLIFAAQAFKGVFAEAGLPKRHDGLFHEQDDVRDI